MTQAEIVTLKLKPGVSDETYVAIARELDAFLASCPGFIQRRLTKAQDGTWTDWLEWRSQADIDAASQGFMAHPAGARLMELTDESTLMMRHEPILLAS